MNTIGSNFTVPFAKKVLAAGVVAMLAFLSACGGGGSDDPPPPPPPTAPSITTQPASVTVLQGAAANFTVVAAGTAPLSYQWQRNGTSIAGATAATYSIANTPVSENSAQFRVVVTNSAGSVTSTAATLTVTATAVAPSITTPPASVTVVDGAAASFTVVAAGTAPLTYQWQRNATNITGATAATYNIASAPLSENTAQYRVVVTNTAGNVTSNAATLTVTAVAPSITTQPQPKTVSDGGTATFTVVAAGSGPLAYQWQRNSVNIAGATSGSYTLQSAALGDNGASYRVVVTSAAGSATSSAAALTVNAIVPSITTQPQAQTVADGAQATFTVTVTGSAPLNVQWRRNAVNISGATLASYTTPANSPANSGDVYSVVVSNTGGTVTSNNAVLTVSSLAPSITTHPVAQTVAEGAPATFTVVAAGSQPLTYQWQRNGTNIVGATNASYTLAQPSPLDTAAVFRAVVTNSVSTATSNTAALTVTRAPLSLLAGKLGGAGSVDGTGGAAQLFSPAATAVDNVGNIYVADRANHTVRKITPAGVVTTVAGQAGVAGHVNAVGNAARFDSPRGIAVSATGVIYVADTNNNAIRRIETNGAVTTYAGSLTGASGSTDAIGTAATFAQPRGIAVDGLGVVYVADTSNHTIREISPGTQTVTTLAGTAGVPAFLNGTGSAARFNFPAGLSVDDAGNVFVADRDNHRIRQVTPAGVVTTIAGEGNASRDDGPVATASFNYPEGVVANPCGEFFVADTENNSIRKISGGGVATVAGDLTNGATGSNDGSGTTARFFRPLGVATNLCNTLYVADSNNNTIRQIGSSGSYPVNTLAGNVGGKGFADGAALDARFNDVRGVAIDSAGNYIVADLANSVIRKLNPTTGVVSTIAGSPGATGNVDGDGSNARFDQPIGVTVNLANNDIYVVDRGSQTIRKITAGGTVSTIAGAAAGYVTGSTDGIGTAALFNDPRGIAYICDILYIADFGNHTVRKLNPVDNAVTTFAGAAGVSGSADGTAALARFNHPRGIAKDGGCNFYLSEYDNNTVRWVNADGSSVTSVAGSPGVIGTADGVGTAAQFDGPTGIVYAGNGVIFVADSRSHLLRKVVVSAPGTTGTVTTLAGQAGSIGVRLGALPGSLGSASGLALIDDTNNVLLVGESLENALLQITAGP